MADEPLLAGSVLVTGGIGKAHAIGVAALGASAGITGRDQGPHRSGRGRHQRRTGQPAVDACAADSRGPAIAGQHRPGWLDSDRALQPESSVI